MSVKTLMQVNLRGNSVWRVKNGNGVGPASREIRVALGRRGLNSAKTGVQTGVTGEGLPTVKFPGTLVVVDPCSVSCPMGLGAVEEAGKTSEASRFRTFHPNCAKIPDGLTNPGIGVN